MYKILSIKVRNLDDNVIVDQLHVDYGHFSVVISLCIQNAVFYCTHEWMRGRGVTCMDVSFLSIIDYS